MSTIAQLLVKVTSEGLTDTTKGLHQLGVEAQFAQKAVKGNTEASVSSAKETRAEALAKKAVTDATTAEVRQRKELANALSAESRERQTVIREQRLEQSSHSRSSGLVSALTTQVMGLAAAYVSVQGAVRLFNETISTAAGYQTLERQLEFLTGGGVAAATKELGYLTDVSNRYGTVLLQSTESYAALASAMKLSGISMQGVHQTYEALSAVAATYALSQDKVNAIMLAFTQIAGKGRVQSEELVRQLGQYIPALQLGAQAMGMSIRDFNKALKEGSVASADFLPKFSALIQEMYGSNLERKTDTIAAAQNRLKTQFQESINAISTQTGASDAYKNALEGLAVAMKSIGDDKEFLNALSAIGTILGFLAKGTIGTVAVPLIVLKDTLSGVSYVMSQVGYALGGIVYGAANSGEAILRASGEWSDFNATLEANKIIQQQIADEELRWVNILNTATSALDDVQKKLQQVQTSQLQGPAKINYWSSVIDDAKSQIEVLQAAQDQLKAQRSALAPQTTSGSTQSRQTASDDIGKLDAAIAEQELALANARLTLANATQSLGNDNDALFISLSKAQATYSSLTGVQKSYADQIGESNRSILSLRETLASLGDYQFGEPPERTQARVNVINGLIDATNRLNAAQSSKDKLNEQTEALRISTLDQESQITAKYQLMIQAAEKAYGSDKAGLEEYEKWAYAAWDAEVEHFKSAEQSKTDALTAQLLKRYGKYTPEGVEAQYAGVRKAASTITDPSQKAAVLGGIDISENDAKIKALQDSYKAEQDSLDFALENKRMSEDAYYASSLAARQAYEDAMKGLAGGNKVILTEEMGAYAGYASQLSSLASGMAGLAKEGTATQKAFFLTSKALAVTSIIMNAHMKSWDVAATTPGLFGMTAKTTILALGYAEAALVAAQTVASFSKGGYTGDGGKYQPAGVVHAGEVVFSQEDVRAHGGVAAVEAYRKGYSDGGIVSYNWTGRGYADGGYAAPVPTVNASSNVNVPIQINNNSDSTVTAKTQTINGQTIVQIAVAQAKSELYNDIASWNGPMANALSAQGVRRG